MPLPHPARGRSFRARLGLECLESRLVPSGDPFLAANGLGLRDGHGTGDPVLLQGTNLGGWLVTEGWMTPRDSSGLPDDYSARQTLIDRFGAATADRLRSTYEDTWITAGDLDRIRDLGMNVVRLPFWYRTLQNEDGTWRDDAFDRMDWLVSAAWDRGLYTILDFHGVPGGQSTEEHTGRKRATAEFWTSAADQQQTADIWKAIASHYQGNPAVAMYDLINEPSGAPSTQAAWGIYDRLYQAIRAVDPDHAITMEGTFGSWSWGMLPNPATYGWTNVVYQMHEYQWGGTGDPAQVRAGIDRQVSDFVNHRSWNVPCLIGEFNEFGPGTDPVGVWQYAVKQFQDNGMNWAEWAYKAIHGGGSDSWGISNPTSPRPGVPNLQTDSAEAIAAKWGAWSTDAAFAINPMLQAALSLRHTATLPDGYAAADVGSPHLRGGTSYDPADGSWLVWASGSDVWGSADQFHFASAAVTGDQVVVARITGMANTDPWAKAGVMLRDSADPGSPFADVMATPANGVNFQWRTQSGGPCDGVQVSGVPVPTPSAPLWVSLERTGNTFRGYYSTDGDNWIQIGAERVLAFSGDDLLAGLAVTSHNNNALNTAAFDNVWVSGLDGGPPSPRPGAYWEGVPAIPIWSLVERDRKP
jgi:aryl-phospho-beta-D-glucosidase BglC (GH1 family)